MSSSIEAGNPLGTTTFVEALFGAVAVDVEARLGIVDIRFCALVGGGPDIGGELAPPTSTLELRL